MKSILFSPETLFSKLRIYFNICLLGNCHLLYRHRVSDIWSSSYRWSCGHWSVEGTLCFWIHTDRVNCLPFSVVTSLHIFLSPFQGLCIFWQTEGYKLKQTVLRLLNFLCEFRTSDLGNVENLAWVKWSTLHSFIFAWIMQVSTLHSFFIFFAEPYLCLTGVQ